MHPASITWKDVCVRMTRKKSGLNRLYEVKAFANLTDYKNDKPMAIWPPRRGNPSPAKPEVTINCVRYFAIWPNDKRWNDPQIP